MNQPQSDATVAQAGAAAMEGKSTYNRHARMQAAASNHPGLAQLTRQGEETVIVKLVERTALPLSAGADRMVVLPAGKAMVLPKRLLLLDAQVCWLMRGGLRATKVEVLSISDVGEVAA